MAASISQSRQNVGMTTCCYTTAFFLLPSCGSFKFLCTCYLIDLGESYIGVIDYMKMWRDHNLPDSAALPALYINGKEPMNYGKSTSSSALRLCVRLFDDGYIQFLGMNQVFLLAFWAIERIVY